MAAIEAADAAHLRERGARRAPRRHTLGIELGGTSRQLVAAALIVLLIIAAAGAFVVLQHFVPPPANVWGGCGGVFQCTTVTVPLDYSRPSAGSIDVAVIRKPATDAAHRIGSLLIIPGGQASGVDYLRANSVGIYSALNARFDLVGVDQRGFGRSAPIRCVSDAQREQLDAIDTVLDDPQEKQIFIEAGQTLGQACRQQRGSLLPYVDTESAARDLDAIRSALNEQRITMLSFGYSTFLGETYARLYPNRVRAFAFDGVTDPARQPTDLWLERAAGTEAHLRAFLANCRANAGCELARSGDPAQRLTRFLDSVDRTPLRAGGRALTRTLAIAALIYGLDPGNWSQLDVSLNAAANGDGDALLALADTSLYGQGGMRSGATWPDAATAEVCLDNPVPSDVAVYDRLGPAFIQASPTFGPAFQYVPLICASWPVHAKRAIGPIGVTGAPPILLVAGTHDPYYPYADAQEVSRQIAGSVLLTRDGYGYLSYFNSLCVRLAVDAYLKQLAVPAPNTVCDSDYPA